MSRCESPFIITNRLPSVKKVRVARNSSLPALPASNISISRSNNASITNQQQVNQRQRSNSPAVISSRRTVATAATATSQTLLMPEIKERKSSLPKIDILNSARTSQVEYQTERLPRMTPEVISEVPGKKIKLQDILKQSARNSTPTQMPGNRRRNPYDHKFVIEHVRVLQLQMENERIHTNEEDEEEFLDWDSEQNSRWLGRSFDGQDENEREGDLFWRFPQKVKFEAGSLHRGIHREESPDLVKCPKCKKCKKCLACKKCTVNYDCADCLSCVRCIKCPKCIQRADLSPEREPDYKKEFFQRFKELDSLDRKGMLRKNPRDYYLKACQLENILPIPLDAFNGQDSDAKRMSFRHYGITNQRAKAIASSITINEDLENVDFTSAGLQGQGMADVLKRLNYKVKTVDLTNNKLDSVGLKAIMALLLNKRYSYLTTLCLEGMSITDRAGEILVNGLGDSNLMILNLSRNHIGNRTTEVLGKFLEESNTIQQIYLHWNKITWKGCCSLAEGAARSESLKVLDISWNKIGHPANKVSAQKLADMVTRNKSIVHLDLSFCGFREEETDEIAKGLQLNQTIIGVHMAGSKFSADAMGFLQRITNMETAVMKDTLWKRISHTERTEREKAIRGAENLKATGNCWICEGWKEVKFVWKNTQNIEKPEPVYVHFGYDNWKGSEMNPDKDDKNTYVVYKMVPPGTLKFYFSIQGNQTDLGEYTEATEDLPVGQQVHNEKQIQVPNVQQSLIVSRVSLMSVEYFDPLESETLDLALERCVPRPRPPGLKIDNTWRFKTSIFKTYKRDDMNLERKCFEFDFEIGRLRKLINKNQEDLTEIKNTLWQYYPRLRAAFKFYSSMSPIGEIFSMPLNPYTEFITQIGVIDGQDLKLHAVDKNFIAVKSNKEHKGKLNPEKALLRGQFIEALVRNAEEKYMITKKTGKYVDAITWFMQDAMKHCEEFDHNAFRLKRLWNPFNDFIYQANLNVMKSVYHKYCDHTNALKNRKNWDQADYDKFLRDVEVVNVYITEREPLLFFNLAMMTQIDELSSNRHLRMTFVEFLDVFARIADRLTPTIDNPMSALYQKIAELIRIAAEKCLKMPDYKVIMPPLTLKEKIIDLSY